MSEMIVTKALTKRFGSILAVDALSLTVTKGEVLGFLGPNGAGKSTSMKMITGFLTPTSGEALVCGHDVSKEPLAVKSRIGYLPEGAPLYPDMTPEAFLAFVAEARGVPSGERKKKIARAVELTQLEGVMRQPIETLSKGFKRRVGIAQSIVHDPEVLILDEPTDGLDPNQKFHVRRLIREMASSGGKAIVLSTHILEEVEHVCTRAVIIAKGRLVSDNTPMELMAKSKYHNAIVLALKPTEGSLVFDELARLPGVAAVEDGGITKANGKTQVRCTVISKGGRPIADIVSAHIRQRGWEVDGMRVEGGKLDDVFREITSVA